MLSVFAEGFFQAQAELKVGPEAGATEPDEKRDPNQPQLFDDLP